MRAPGSRALLTCLAVILGAIILLWVYAAFDPAVDRWFPRCAFKMATGLDCPGCGSQRAIHALAHRDIASAWRFNAAFVIAIPLLLFIVIGRRWRRLRRVIDSRPFILAIFFMLLGWWILRNIFF